MAASSSSQGFSGGHSFSPFTSSASSSSSSAPAQDSYFSIDDILASQQKVPVQFETTVYNLGFLNPSANERNLEPGLKVELPFWLSKVLGGRKRQIVKVELPKQYRRNLREILKADAKVVDLYKMGPYYYGLGMKLLCFDQLECRELSRCLLETFLNRFRQLMDNAQHAEEADTFSLTSKLDEVERVLFHLGQRTAQQMGLWERGQSQKITSSLIVQANRKRKRRPS